MNREGNWRTSWMGLQGSGTCNEIKILRFYLEHKEESLKNFKLDNDMIEWLSFINIIVTEVWTTEQVSGWGKWWRHQLWCYYRNHQLTLLISLNLVLRTVVGSGESEVKAFVTQLCLTCWEPARMLCPWILQARILEWAAIPFSRESSQPRDLTWGSLIAGRFFTDWATGEAHSVVGPQKCFWNKWMNKWMDEWMKVKE